MPETTGGPVNGKFVGPVPMVVTETTETAITSTGKGEITLEIKKEERQVSERIEPKDLYRYYSQSTNSFEVDAPLALVSQVFAVAADRFKRARDEEEEISRENQIAMGFEAVVSASRFLGGWPSLDEVLAILFVIRESHRHWPYARKEILALHRVCEMMRRNPAPPPEQVDSIHDDLEAADLDVNSPMDSLDLTDADESE